MFDMFDMYLIMLAMLCCLVTGVVQYWLLETVQLKVEGISDLSAYSLLMNYVSGLGLVQNAKASSLNGEILELELDLLGGSAELFELIALDRDLLPIQSSQRDDLKVLHYRWTR